MGGREQYKKFKRCMNSKVMRDLRLPLAILFGALIGVALGMGLRTRNLTKFQAGLLMLPGDIMIQLMKMLLLPITVGSIVVSMASLDVKTTGKIGIRAMVYYLSTLVLACVVGIALSLAITPTPLYVPTNSTETLKATSNPGVSFTDLIRNLFPDNLIEATFRKTVTEIVDVPKTDGNGTEQVLRVKKVGGMNLLGLLVFSIMLGVVLGSLGEQGEPLVRVFNGIFLGSIKLILIFIWYIPIGVIFILASNMVKMENPGEMFTTVGMLVGLLGLGLFIHAFILLPLLYFLFVRKNPFKFIYNQIPAMLTAFGTESSAATIPINMRCLEEKNRVDSRIVRMIIPLGATVNMDGTCLYLNMVAIFISYLHATPVNVGQIFTIALMAISISIGVAAVPGGGGGNMEIAVLTAVGLPVEDVYVIYTVYWLMARMRTAVNVMGDAYGCGIVEKLSSRDLRRMSVLRPELKHADIALLRKQHEETVRNVDINDSHMEKGLAESTDM